jgi:hypothetical protein
MAVAPPPVMKTKLELVLGAATVMAALSVLLLPMFAHA